MMHIWTVFKSVCLYWILVRLLRLSALYSSPFFVYVNNALTKIPYKHRRIFYFVYTEYIFSIVCMCTRPFICIVRLFVLNTVPLIYTVCKSVYLYCMQVRLLSLFYNLIVEQSMLHRIFWLTVLNTMHFSALYFTSAFFRHRFFALKNHSRV